MTLNRVVLATSNEGKIREFTEALAPLGWTLVPLPRVTMPPEDGATYEENAALKACAISLQTGLPAIADDSGLEVTALRGEPGVYSARFGGRKTDVERNVYLLERLRDAKAKDRSAKFVSVIVLAYPDGHLETYRGEAPGVILEGPRGEGGFGYDPLFVPAGNDRSFGEMSVEEKRPLSHRGRALGALLDAHKNGPPEREIISVE
ncbi:RdgB/HAM1 family non-canonical purine NTP pyrophosphatase [Deinococcus yavapaiensis]|uniref:dITP/XTP pyrophosphatase n=1 Tax=Deinococcus yavapaiensis KR-236 TaxID=694435 RepID=A0A318S2A7_9DEIO|nr:RdgB/HAM1 family non-canonical purine NTP pyrophosphatase [Deinococcus yavapaiensis]PYE49876.1 XTP/dITP diphosphohydrolase [Deinococcus yavapaiensis KR-236]